MRSWIWRSESKNSAQKLSSRSEMRQRSLALGTDQAIFTKRGLPRSYCSGSMLTLSGIQLDAFGPFRIEISD